MPDSSMSQLECSCPYPNPRWGDMNPSCEVHGRGFESARQEMAEYVEARDRYRDKLLAIANAVAASEPEVPRRTIGGVTVFFPDPVWFTIQTAKEALNA